MSDSSGDCPAAERAASDMATSSALLGDVNVRCRSALVALQRSPTACWQSKQSLSGLTGPGSCAVFSLVDRWMAAAHFSTAAHPSTASMLIPTYNCCKSIAPEYVEII